MNERIIFLLRNADLSEGAPEDLLADVQSAVGGAFPPDYAVFLNVSNGATGMVGQTYVALWRLEDIVPLNIAAEVSEFAAGLVLFGTDGADTGYAFDLRSKPTHVVSVPLIGMSLESAKTLSETFLGFLEHLYALEP